MKWYGYQCVDCLTFQKAQEPWTACGSIDVRNVRVEAFGPSSEPTPAASGGSRSGTVHPHVSGLDPAALELLAQIERLVGNHSFARAQALGVALWRSIARTPHYAWQTHYDVSTLQLSDGGRHLRLTADVFPPTPSVERP